MDKKDRLNLGSILEDDEVLIIDWVILIECTTGMKKLMEEVEGCKPHTIPLQLGFETRKKPKVEG